MVQMYWYFSRKIRGFVGKWEMFLWKFVGKRKMFLWKFVGKRKMFLVNFVGKWEMLVEWAIVCRGRRGGGIFVFL